MALAEVGAPIGLKGALRLHTLKSVTGLPIDDTLLIAASDCWVRLADRRRQVSDTVPDTSHRWLYSRIIECSPQTRGLKLQLEAVADRNQAELLRGAAVGLSRGSFPEPDEDEAYWADLMGCKVVNRQGEELGEVRSMQTNGEHDWLVLEAGMIPFVSHYIDKVDTESRVITVDWSVEWWK